MPDKQRMSVMPYSAVVGQQELKLALELVFVNPRIGGVLLSGEKGTGKSTIVRGFSQMVLGKLPVTLPINATEDRVVGGWELSEVLAGRLQEKPGLLELANGCILYIDEVNLLEDHIANIILDVSSPGVLSVQREGRDDDMQIDFTLIGTMNPEEGLLRPQLLDRFGVAVSVHRLRDFKLRSTLIRRTLSLKPGTRTYNKYIKEDSVRAQELQRSRERVGRVRVTDQMIKSVARIAESLELEGHRGEMALVESARALCAIEGGDTVGPAQIEQVARMALQHRRAAESEPGLLTWDEAEERIVSDALEGTTN